MDEENSGLPNRAVFATLVTDNSELKAARMLINSKHTFAGALAGEPFLVYSTFKPDNRPVDFAENAALIQLSIPETLSGYLFGSKVFACYQAEEFARDKAKSIIWMDPAGIILRPPVDFLLENQYTAAFRPVHIRNIGQLVDKPLSGYWAYIYEKTGNRIPEFRVNSFVDSKEIYPYFNTHCFSIDPDLGLCRRWVNIMQELICDSGFQQNYCTEGLFRVFLHQAIMSALVTNELNENELKILPHDYSYPYHLQKDIPEEKRAKVMNNLTCMVYENLTLDPEQIEDIEIEEPLYSWLKGQLSLGE